MAQSRLQDLFMKEYAATFRATLARLQRRMEENPASTAAIVEDELRGLFHGLLVIFDGGSGLADKGLISIVDEDGQSFDRYLHEICFGFWSERL